MQQLNGIAAKYRNAAAAMTPTGRLAATPPDDAKQFLTDITDAATTVEQLSANIKDQRVVAAATAANDAICRTSRQCSRRAISWAVDVRHHVYAFFLVHLASRRMVHIAATRHPVRASTAPDMPV